MPRTITIAIALLAPFLAPFDPYEVHVRYKYANPGAFVEETGQRFWLGADQLGRDVPLQGRPSRRTRCEHVHEKGAACGVTNPRFDS